MPELLFKFVCVTRFWISAIATQALHSLKEYKVTASKVYDTILQFNQKFPTQQCNSMLAD